jgi:hypothetical protein
MVQRCGESTYEQRERVGEERGGKEKDRCPLTAASNAHVFADAKHIISLSPQGSTTWLMLASLCVMNF